jgi:putative phosphoribosyl transferase
MRFRDRVDGGRRLAGLLNAYARRADVVVLALPRGGVPVAFEVARELKAPLDVFVVRKLGVPGHPELAMGAIASGGACSAGSHQRARDSTSLVEEVSAREQLELERRDHAYRGDRIMPPCITAR